ncbi:MAG: type II secretion system protein [Clostridiales bacterium]|nr:type II secretion system protein [Clostridiales bacterium]
MKRIHSSKRGFTLVEMMLALAIIAIIGWTTVALMIATKDSFMTTYNNNDSADYAMLYANGFENSFLAHTQNHTAGTFGTRPADSVLEDKPGHAVFTPNYMKTTNVNSGNVVDKWIVRTYFYFDPKDASQTVKYKVYVIDNYYSPTWRVMSEYEGSVWAPHMGTGKIALVSGITDPEGIDSWLRTHYSLTGWGNYIKFTP